MSRRVSPALLGVSWTTVAQLLSVHGLLLSVLVLVALAVVRALWRDVGDELAEFTGDVAAKFFSSLRRRFNIERRRDTQRRTS